MECVDVLIVGGGPAGSSLAHFLKEKGIDSLIVERGGENRNKVCAGGLPVAVKSVLPESVRNFKKVDYHILKILYKNGLSAISKGKTIFSYGVKRSEFDAYLRKGLNVRYNENFLNFEETKTGIIAKTDKGKYTAKFLIGADGVGSKVSVLTGLAPKKRFIVAEEAEVPFSGIFNGTMQVFLGYNSIGYGWIFPKEDFLSVGSGALKNRFRKNTIRKFYPGEYKTKIYPISLWGGPEQLHKGRIALTGEAANLVDPFTAGGIYPAILSSRVLSDAIEKALKNGSSEISGYEDSLESVIYEDFKYALFLSRMFYPFLPLVKKYVVKESTVNLALQLSAQGYISYRTIYERVRQSKHVSLKFAYLLIKKLFK